MGEPAPFRRPTADEADLASVYARVKNDFRAAGLATPDLDARVLVTETLGVSTAQLVANPRRPVPADLASLLAKRVAARLDGQSIGRILSRRAFWSLDLRVGPATLEPRPETETVVELALKMFEGHAPPATIADLGVGTGAILLALLTEHPTSTGLGVDVSFEALEEARRNAERTGLAGRVHLVRSDFGAALGDTFDLVVSNPPYIESSVIAGLEKTVRDFDPPLALDGGPDGLCCYRKVFGEAPQLLSPRGRLVVEINPDAVDAVVAEAERCGLCVMAMADDLAGRARAIAFCTG
ncbi:MAG: peptide chain release factor N(5)-glutamine methyltransferase [Pseudomonadota bacterium]